MSSERRTERLGHRLLRARSARAAAGGEAGTSKEDVEALLRAANDAAGSTRTIYLITLALALFFAIVTAGLTDAKLLRDSAVALPLIENVDLPLSTFFLVAPWVLVLVHGDLLLHFTLLAKNLYAFDRSARRLSDHDRRQLCLQLSSFLFAQCHACDREYRVFRSFILWVTVAVIPVLVLLYAQLGFLPYHGEGIAWVQRLALLADLALLAVFWPSVLQVDLTPRQWWTRVMQPGLLAAVGRAEWRRGGLRAWLAWHGQRRERVRGGVRLALLIVFALFVSLIVATIPDETWERQLIALHAALGGDAVASSSNETPARFRCRLGPLDLFQLDVTDPYDPAQSTSSSKAGNRVSAALPSGMTALCPTVLVFHSSLPLFRSLHRTLSLREGLFIGNDVPLDDLSRIGSGDARAAESALAKIQPLELDGRNLLFADFSRARLYRADLRGAQLRGANFTGAHLQGANLFETQLQLANLRWAQLQAANLSDAQLQGADLSLTRLDGADLSRTELQGADLRGAQLRGADLNLAELQGADLRGARLDGAALHSAELQGADLRGAQLQNADLTVAQLQQTDLQGAQLQGATLYAAELQGADLRGAQLQGAFLARAQLQGADLTGANLTLTILEQASFDALTEEDVAAIRRSPGWSLIPEPGRSSADRSLQGLSGQPAVVSPAPAQCLGTPVGLSAEACVEMHSPQARAFSEAYAAFLATLTCHSKAARYAVEGYVRGANVWDELFAISRKRFAKAILECPAAASLSEETKSQLEAWRDGNGRTVQ